MSERPDKKQVKDLVRRAESQNARFAKALDGQKAEIAEVRRAADLFYNEKFKAELCAMSVDMLTQSKQGVRVTHLKAAGIENVYQLSQLSRMQIEAFDGIGAQGAEKIYELTQSIVENTRTKMSLRIDVDSPAKADDAIIGALYKLIVHDELRARMLPLYEANYRSSLKEITRAGKAAGAISWFFASKAEREESVLAVRTLSERLSGEYGDEGLFADYVAADEADVTECRAHFRENSAKYYATLEKYCKHLNTEEKKNAGLPEELVRKIEALTPDLSGLKATLRGYQEFGVKYAIHQKRTLLGDEMGLGKTIQAIAAMIALKAEGKHHFMVVCPASVLINWCREIKKFSDLEVTKIHGADEQSLRRWRENGDVAVTTYESISRFTLPERFSFDFLVVDEAHYVKNPEAQRTVAMKKLLEKTEGVLYMSGTPLVNRVDEMCFLVECLQPKIAERLEAVKAVSTAEQFRSELSGVYLRRVREDVLKELPDLIEKEQWCELSGEEGSIYRDAVASGNLMAIRQVSWQVDDISKSSKAMRLFEICESAREQGRKVIVFSFFRNTLDKVHALLGERCSETISGDISPAKRQEIVDKFNAADPGAILVSQVQAGGTGLNIQAASVVVFCEPQLTPAIENQAIGRAYRMGQTRDVQVHRLLCDDTVDERILEILSNKQREFDSFADESVVGDIQMAAEQGSSWIAKMVEEEQKRLSLQKNQ
ncbi:MAG: DEAD/DEAH box helicase [Clostridia bacterium]|nr:DEAD/DEAH box helicase [Clostridia bacterium]